MMMIIFCSAQTSAPIIPQRVTLVKGFLKFYQTLLGGWSGPGQPLTHPGIISQICRRVKWFAQNKTRLASGSVATPVPCQ